VRDGDAHGKANAAFALLKLAAGVDATKAAISFAGAIEPLATLVRDGDAQGKANAAGALANLVAGDETIGAAIAVAVRIFNELALAINQAVINCPCIDANRDNFTKLLRFMQANFYLFNYLRPIPAQTSLYIVMNVDLEAMNFLDYKRPQIRGV